LRVVWKRTAPPRYCCGVCCWFGSFKSVLGSMVGL
jgi:hypothetical protein